MAGEAVLSSGRRAGSALPAVALCALASVACVDFVDITHAGPSEAARLEVFVHLIEDTIWCAGSCRFPDGSVVPPGPDGGVAWTHARLRPGADAGGTPRLVVNETLTVSGFVVPRDTLLPDGERLYRRTLPVAMDTLERIRITLEPPVVDLVLGLPPEIAWHLPASEGPDTIHHLAQKDLVLRLRPPSADPQPAFSFFNWTLVLTGERPVRIGSTGPPPLEIRVPPHFVPDPIDGVVTARLDLFLGGAYLPAPSDLATTVIIDARVGWVVLVGEADPPAVEGGMGMDRTD